jgi:hypothetical protein
MKNVPRNFKKTKLEEFENAGLHRAGEKMLKRGVGVSTVKKILTKAVKIVKNNIFELKQGSNPN